MKTRILYTKFWQDAYIGDLYPTDRLLFVYLLLNSHVGLCEVYELSDRTICFETGLTKAQLEKAKEKFARDGKFAFYKGWLKILNYEKYNQYLGEKNDIAREKECTLVPKEIMGHFENSVAMEYRYPSDTTNNHKSIINNQNKGVVKGKFSSLKDIEEKDFAEIAENYKVSIPFVRSCFDSLVNYCQSKGKTYRDYKAALRNFVKNDAIRLMQNQKRGGYVDATDI